MSASCYCCWIANVKMGRDIFFSCFSQPLFFVTGEEEEKQVARQKPSKVLFKSFYSWAAVGKCKGYIPDRLSNGLNISLGILSKRETLRGCPNSRVSYSKQQILCLESRVLTLVPLTFHKEFFNFPKHMKKTFQNHHLFFILKIFQYQNNFFFNLEPLA